MTARRHDNALMLEVIAGADGLDPRQYDVVTDRYTATWAAVSAGCASAW
jgi:amidase